MAYITNANIQERLGSDTYVQLSDDNGDNIADIVVVDAAREAAEGEVDSYLARRFATPVDLNAYPSAAGVLRAVTLDLVEHRLRSRRPPVSVDAERRRASAIAWLENVAAGEIELPTVVQLEGAVGLVAKSLGAKRAFSREGLSGH